MYRRIIELGQCETESIFNNDNKYDFEHTVGSKDNSGKIDLVFLVKTMLEHIQARNISHMNETNRRYFTKGMHKLLLLTENIK